MKFSYKFSNLLGSVYKKGNLVFTDNGDVLLSPVGNRITMFDLKNNKSETLPLESRYNFTTLALSPNRCTVLAANEVGELTLCSLISRTALHSKHFKKPIRDIKFSPDGKYFALTKDNLVMVYRAPGRHTREYNPFAMYRVFHASHEETTCLEWSHDSRVLAVGGRDMCVRLYPVEKCSNMSVYTLGSHSDRIVGCFFEEESLDISTVSRNGQLCVWESSKDLDDLQLEGEGHQQPTSGDETPGKIFYKRIAKHYLKDAVKAKGHVVLLSATYHQKSHLLATGFSNGAFLLHEMPGCNLIHSLTLENRAIGALAFNRTGDWIAMGGSASGQLVVWEWQSESFVLKQQGHWNNLTCVAYSPDGQHLVTGGDDGKIKLWDTGNGFCFATFSEPKSGITGIVFVQSGKAIVAASLDGTVRAFDLHRYRNFRTFTSPRPTQFSCLAADPSGEIVAAGSQDSFEIFVWSMQTGRLLDVLSGHEAPVSSICFSPRKSVLISSSWDKTVRTWDVFEGKGGREVITLVSDGLAVEFRADGREVAVATLNGQIIFFDPETTSQVGSIEGRNDLGSGRAETDLITAKKSLAGQAFTTLCYTADGDCILAGGRSKMICIYHVKEQILLKKFEVTCNHSFDAVDDFINRRKMTEFGNIALIESRLESGENVDVALPGVRKGDMASRAFKPEARVSCVMFSPTGRAFACTTTEGLLVYSLDHGLVFDPFELEVGITPQSIRQALDNAQFSTAILMAFKLNERKIIREVLERVPTQSVELISQSLPEFYVEKVLAFLGDELEQTRHVEFYLVWIEALLVGHGPHLKNRSQAISSTLRNLQKNLTLKYSDLAKICDHNKYAMRYATNVALLKRKRESQIDK